MTFTHSHKIFLPIVPLLLFFVFCFFSPSSVFACVQDNECKPTNETCCSGNVRSVSGALCSSGKQCTSTINIKPTVSDPIKSSNDVSISTITTTTTKIPNTLNLSSLLTGGGFNLINFVFIIIGLLFFANLIMAGWDYMFSSGDPKKVTAATTRLINGVIGLAVAAAAFIVVRLITTMLGLGNLI